MALEPITRQEQIIAGKDLKPITRMEKFLKEYGGGASGGALTVTITKHVDYSVTPNIITYSIDKTAEEIQQAYSNGTDIKWHLIEDNDTDFGFLNVASVYNDADGLTFNLSSAGQITTSQDKRFVNFDDIIVGISGEGNELKCWLMGGYYSFEVTAKAGSKGFIE